MTLKEKWDSMEFVVLKINKTVIKWVLILGCLWVLKEHYYRQGAMDAFEYDLKQKKEAETDMFWRKIVPEWDDGDGKPGVIGRNYDNKC